MLNIGLMMSHFFMCNYILLFIIQEAADFVIETVTSTKSSQDQLLLLGLEMLRDILSAVSPLQLNILQSLHQQHGGLILKPVDQCIPDVCFMIITILRKLLKLAYIESNVKDLASVILTSWMQNSCEKLVTEVLFSENEIDFVRRNCVKFLCKMFMKTVKLVSELRLVSLHTALILKERILRDELRTFKKHISKPGLSCFIGREMPCDLETSCDSGYQGYDPALVREWTYLCFTIAVCISEHSSDGTTGIICYKSLNITQQAKHYLLNMCGWNWVHSFLAGIQGKYF